MTADIDSGDNDFDEEEPLPTISEQVSQQLGGLRGLIEASIPVLVFVVVNFIGSQNDRWPLTTSLIVSVGFALVLAAYRLVRHQPIRHAMNGVFGILIGAVIALRSGEARDFYLPGMLYTVGYSLVMLLSVVVRRPMIGWLWAVTLDGGAPRWYKQPRLRRVFVWMTVLWATIYLVKVAIQFSLYTANQDNWLGVTRIAFGWPPYALLFALTVWAARRVIAAEELVEGSSTCEDPSTDREPVTQQTVPQGRG